MGLRANLTCGEMLEQVPRGPIPATPPPRLFPSPALTHCVTLQLMHANAITPIRNVVFMGMGEPLDNYEEVLGALRAMVDTGRFGLSPARVTVSTVGVVPRIRSLAKVGAASR